MNPRFRMTVDCVEEDVAIPQPDFIVVQVYGGGAAKVEFRDLTITELK